MAYISENESQVIERIEATASKFTLKRATSSKEAVHLMDQARLIAVNAGPPNSFIYTVKSLS